MQETVTSSPHRNHLKMVNNNKAIKDFLDNVSDEKLKNFVLGEKTIVESKKFGFRLDHQGVSETYPGLRPW